MANYNLTQTGDEVQAYIDSIPVIDVTGTLSGSNIVFATNPYTQIAANYAADCSSIVRLTVGTSVYLLRVTQYDGTNYTAVEMSGAHNVVATIGSSSASATIDAGIDAIPTQGSNNLVKSGGVYEELSQLGQEVRENEMPITRAGRYITTNNGVGHHYGGTVTDANYSYYRFPVKEGDKVVLNGEGGTSGRLFAFIDSDGIILRASAANIIAKDWVVDVPQDAAEIIINTKDTSIPCYYVVTDGLYECVDLLDEQVESNTKKIGDLAEFEISPNLCDNSKVWGATMYSSGQIVASTTTKVTPYIDVRGLNRITFVVRTNNTSTGPFFAFYNENRAVVQYDGQSKVSSLNGSAIKASTAYTITPPTNATHFVLGCSNSTLGATGKFFVQSGDTYSGYSDFGVSLKKINSSNETIAARGGFPTLGDRLDETDKCIGAVIKSYTPTSVWAQVKIESGKRYVVDVECSTKKDNVNLGYNIGANTATAIYIVGTANTGVSFPVGHSRYFFTAQIDASYLRCATTGDNYSFISSIKIYKYIDGEKLEELVDKQYPAIPATSFSSQLASYEAVNVSPQDYKVVGSQHLIKIQSQEDFDNIQSLVNTAIANGATNILVLLDKEGQLYFSEKHFDLTPANYPNASSVSLSITSTPKTKLIAVGDEYNAEDANAFSEGKYVLPRTGGFDWLRSFMAGDKMLNSYSTWRFLNVRASSTGASMVDAGGHTIYEYKLPLAEQDKNTDATHLELVENYVGRYFKIDRVNNGYAYFWDIYALNERSDSEGKIGPQTSERYRLLNSSDMDVYVTDSNIQISAKYNSIHECTAVHFANIGDAFKSVVLSELNFYGSADQETFISKWNTLESELISVDGFNPVTGTEGSYVIPSATNGRFVRIDGCIFRNIKSRAVHITNKSCNILFKENSASGCFKGIFSTDEMCQNIFVLQNTIKNVGQSFTQSAALACAGQNWLIAENKVFDYGYTAISGGSPLGIGNMHTIKTTTDYSSQGIIENNLVAYTEEYANDWGNLMGDGGAIYSYEWAKQLIIRRNIILNYRTATHMGAGIYCDGYMPNYAVYANLVIGIYTQYNLNGFCDFFTAFGTAGDASDTLKGKNRFIGFNLFTGRVRAYCSPNNTDCYYAQNYRAVVSKDSQLTSKSNFAYEEDDYFMTGSISLPQNVSVEYGYYNVIANSLKLPAWAMAYVLMNKF